ncbi:MAG: toprim domain-containing protein [Solirubrobacteraceae bacterium]
MAEGDVRGFYARLGVELPQWASGEAAVSCFADPDAHKNQDRSKSCSVNLASGAWHCWGCGAKGGAYDAALARGLDSRHAFELKVAYGLAERDPKRPQPSARTGRLAARSPRADVERPAREPGHALAVSERDMDGWRADLERMRWPLRVMRSEHRALWKRETLLALGLGFHRGRVIFPIRDRDGRLEGVLRYAPTHEKAPKMLAAAGTTLALVPHPAADPSVDVLLVEGPPDMLAARCQGWSAFGIPGDDAWQPEWAQLLAGRRVTIVMDADQAGRTAAARIAADLVAVALEVRVADLHPGREDGTDLTDWLIANRDASASELRARLARTTTLVSPPPATELDPEREAALRAALERCEPVLGSALVGQLADGLPVVYRGLVDAGESEVRAVLADGREAWRALDQAGAREALALAGEQQRTAAVLAGVRACITEITSAPTGLASTAVAGTDNARGRQLAELGERAQQLQARGGRIAERLDALCERDATPERWAQKHARAFLQGLAAREILHARQLAEGQQGGRIRPRERTEASATAPARPEHPATDADPYVDARAALALAAAARPPVTRAKSASLPVAVPARPRRTTGTARSPRPHR